MKFCKLKKVIKNNKGVTLVELILCMVLLSIIILATAQMIQPTLTVYYDSLAKAESASLLDSLTQEMSFFANGIVSASFDSLIDTDGDGNGDSRMMEFRTANGMAHFLAIKDGRLYNMNAPDDATGFLVLPEDLYEGRSLAELDINDILDADGDPIANLTEIAEPFYVRFELIDRDGTTVIEEKLVPFSPITYYEQETTTPTPP